MNYKTTLLTDCDTILIKRPYMLRFLKINKFKNCIKVLFFRYLKI
jgi:hypothetical protein